MASKSMAEVYTAVCERQGIDTNDFISEALEEATGNGVVRLRGSRAPAHARRLDDGDALTLSESLLSLGCVTELDVSYNNLTDEGAAHLAVLLQQGANLGLLSLDLTFNNFHARGAEVLAKSLQGNTSLLALRLSGNKVGSSGVKQLAKMLHENQTLQELQLANCDLDIQSVIAFAIVMKSNKTLRAVDISHPLLFTQQEEWALHFSEMLLLNSCLVELHLGKMGMTDTGMERLTEGLILNRSLRHLDLRCNRITCDGAGHLSGVLRRNATLRVVDLSCNRIEDGGAVHLSDALAWPGCGLRELSVCRNNVGTVGLLSLAQALSVNTSLTHLYVWGNHLEEPVCQAFDELISSGRLPPEQTDVSAYEVDGQVFLAEVFHTLRKHYDSCNADTESDPPPAEPEPEPELLKEQSPPPLPETDPEPELSPDS